MDLAVSVNLKNIVLNRLRNNRELEEPEHRTKLLLDNFSDNVENLILDSYYIYKNMMKEGVFSISGKDNRPILGIALYVENKLDKKNGESECSFTMLEIFSVYNIDEKTFRNQVYNYLNLGVYNTAFDLVPEYQKPEIAKVQGIINIFGRYFHNKLRGNSKSSIRLNCALVRDANKVFYSHRIDTTNSNESIRSIAQISYWNKTYKKIAEKKVKDIRHEPVSMPGTGEYFGSPFDTYMGIFASCCMFDAYFSRGKLSTSYLEDIRMVDTNIVGGKGCLTIINIIGKMFVDNFENKYIQYNLMSISPFNTSMWFSFGLDAVIKQSLGQAEEARRRGEEINEEMVKKATIKVYPFLELEPPKFKSEEVVQ